MKIEWSCNILQFAGLRAAWPLKWLVVACAFCLLAAMCGCTQHVPEKAITVELDKMDKAAMDYSIERMKNGEVVNGWKFERTGKIRTYKISKVEEK
jgi:hypothetical protein